MKPHMYNMDYDSMGLQAIGHVARIATHDIRDHLLWLLDLPEDVLAESLIACITRTLTNAGFSDLLEAKDYNIRVVGTLMRRFRAELFTVYQVLSGSAIPSLPHDVAMGRDLPDTDELRFTFNDDAKKSLRSFRYNMPMSMADCIPDAEVAKMPFGGKARLDWPSFLSGDEPFEHLMHSADGQSFYASEDDDD